MNTFGLFAMKSLRNLVLLSAFLLVSNVARAEDLLGYLIDSTAKYSGPSLEDNVVLMDTDKNGFADVFEVRAFWSSSTARAMKKSC